MDKNNDIKVNKVNKWDYGVVDMSLWHLKDEFDALVDKLNGVYGIDVFKIEELTADTYSSLDKVLERFNELEAVHQKECGMISQYEEENRNLKSELDIITDENDGLISRVFKQDEEYQKLEAKYKEIYETDEFHQKIHRKVQDEYAKIAAENAELRSQCQSKDDALQKMIKDYESEIKQIIELAKSYGLIIYDDRKDAIPDDVVNIGMCGHYYVLSGRIKEESKNILELKQHYEEELKIRCEEIDSKNKLIDELNSKIRMLKLREFMLPIYHGYGLNNAQYELNRKIKELEKEIKDLKDLLDRNENFGKYVGERVADSIREGCDKGVYKLHPFTKIDIHVEEIKDVPLTFVRYAIQRISVIFNNTQTEMELTMQRRMPG